jgi:hypothetical protein
VDLPLTLKRKTASDGGIGHSCCALLIINMAAVILIVMLAATLKPGGIPHPVRPVCAGERQATNLLVFHDYGEGSHALSAMR